MILNLQKHKNKKTTKYAITAILTLSLCSIVSMAYTTPSQEDINTQGTETTVVKDEPVILNGFVDDGFGTRYYRNNEYVSSVEIAYSSNEIYSFDDNGYMRTGWYCNEDGFRFYRPNGMEKQEWIYDGLNWYYLKDGEMFTGWHQIPDKTRPENVYWYYFGSNGQLYTDTVAPDGKTVDFDGKLIEQKTEEERTTFSWDKSKTGTGTLSGLYIAGMPAEFYMLSIAGETSGLQNLSAVSQGDRGRAYGVCQFDYRYDLVGFMNYAYGKHPDLWSGFKDYLYVSPGNPILVYNDTIGNTFISSMRDDYETSMSDQLEYFRSLYWDKFKVTMDAAGYDLDNRHIAVSAAFFSVNVNCGTQTGIYLNNLNPSMTDEELIRGIYQLRNTVMAELRVGNHKKGTCTRYLSAEPEMALDLLYGYTTIDTVRNYGGGVEWGGNPFVNAITTIPNVKIAPYVPFNAYPVDTAVNETEQYIVPERQDVIEPEAIEETQPETEYSEEYVQIMGPAIEILKNS